MNQIRWRDLGERVFWTFVAAFLGALLGAPIVVMVIEQVSDASIDLDAIGAAVVAAALAGLTAAANAVLVIARWRLSVLPNPGQAVADAAGIAGYARAVQDLPRPPAA